MALNTAIVNHPSQAQGPREHYDKGKWDEKFKGHGDDLPSFLIKLRMRTMDVSDVQTKLRIAVGALTGSALRQVKNKITDGYINLASLGELKDILELAFRDPDKKGTAQRKL